MIVDMIVALIVTLVLGGLVVSALGWRRAGEADGTPRLDVAALVLAGTYAVVLFGGWLLRPLGFDAAGATWTPFLLVGVLLSLLIVAVTTTAPRSEPSTSVSQAAVTAEQGRMGLGSTAAGLLLLGLIAALMALWTVLLIL